MYVKAEYVDVIDVVPGNLGLLATALRNSSARIPFLVDGATTNKMRRQYT